MGRGSTGYFIAQLAIETGIAPQDLLDLDGVMFNNLVQVINDRAEERRSASRGKRRIGSA